MSSFASVFYARRETTAATGKQMRDDAPTDGGRTARLIRQTIVAVMAGGVPISGIDDILSIAEAIAAAMEEGY